MIECFYIPGLNNYGDDRVHIGPLKFFRMHEVLEQYLGREGIRLIPFYPPRARLLEKSDALAEKLTTQVQAILLGHSTGGILARSVSHNPRVAGKIKGIVTFGCPHHGSHLATEARRIADASLLRQKLLQLVGYDIKKFREFILDLSPESLEIFNKNFPIDAKTPVYSIISGKKPGDLPLAFKLLYLYSGDQPAFATDGIVSIESQNFGKVIGNFDLDHLNQIGFFKHLVNPIQKKQTLAEFGRFIKTISSTIKEISHL